MRVGVITRSSSIFELCDQKTRTCVKNSHNLRTSNLEPDHQAILYGFDLVNVRG